MKDLLKPVTVGKYNLKNRVAMGPLTRNRALNAERIPTELHVEYYAQRTGAGIVLNRWGHAYISPQPGFHFGINGKEAPKEIVKQGFGRIQFGPSELSGYMSHTAALKEGVRAATQVMKKIDVQAGP